MGGQKSAESLAYATTLVGKKNVVRHYTGEAIKKHAKGVASTPDFMLDAFESAKIAKRSEMPSPLTAASVDEYGRVKMSPILGDTSSLPHEGTHLALQRHWSSPNRRKDLLKLPQKVRERIYNASFISEPRNAIARSDQAQELYRKHYNELPTEADAVELSEWIVKRWKTTNKVPTEKETLARWDKQIAKRATEMKKKHPEMYEMARGANYLARRGNLPEYHYKDVPDSLMGISKNPMKQKGYGEHPGYKTNIDVEVMYPATKGFPENRWFDGMDGLNKKHALERARRNWPGAKVRIRHPSIVPKEDTNLQEWFNRTFK